MQNIKRKDELLQQIAAGLNHILYKKGAHHKLNNDPKLSTLEVTLKTDVGVVLVTDLITALDYLANDIYWDEDNNWAEATIAEVSTI